LLFTHCRATILIVFGDGMMRLSRAFAVFWALTPVAALAQTPDPVIAQIRDLSADLAQGRACNWLLSFDEIALNGKIADNAARVRAEFGAAAGNVADLAAKTTPKPDPCNGPADQQMQTQVVLLRLEWFARADSLYTTSEAASFGKAMTSLGSSQAIRKQEYDRLRAVFVAHSDAAQWDQAYAGIGKDALATIGLTCGDRAKVRTKEPRKCPAVPEATKKFIPMAVAQLRSVEAFATAYENAAKAIAAAAMVAANDVANFWKATAAASSANSPGGVVCSSGDKVVDFNGRRAQKGKDAAGKDVVVAPIIAFGNPIEIGTVTAAATGPDYVLLSADDKAKAAGVGDSVIFKHCSPA
jgi:hypothetical protein